MAPSRKFRLKMSELVHILTMRILSKLNSYNGLAEAKTQLWQRVRAIVKEQYPESKWTYNIQQREWESHPLQRYIRLIELRFPLPKLPDNLSIEEWNEYLIWKSENHQGIKEWKRYGRSRPKSEAAPKGNIKEQTSMPKGNRAYVPGGKTRGPEIVRIEGLKKKT